MNSIYEIRILVVDDNTDLLRLLQEQLTDAGYRHIQTVRSCAEAKRAFAADIPQLMILDINLPDGDGFPCSGLCGAKQISPHCFCQPGMQTPTACLGWVSARMIT